MRRNTSLRLRVPQSRTSMYAPVGILAAPCLARISAFTASYCIEVIYGATCKREQKHSLQGQAERLLASLRLPR